MQSFDELLLSLNAAASVGDLPTLLHVADLLVDVGSPVALAHAQRARAIHASVVGRSDEALVSGHAALRIFEDLEDHDGVARTLNGIGNDYLGIGDYASSLTSYHRALSIFQTQHNERGEALVIGNIGNVHANSGAVDQAIDCYQQALAIFQRHGSEPGIARLLGNIGMVYTRIGEKDLAQQHLLPSLERYRNLADRNGIARITGHLFETHMLSGETDSAMQRLEEMDAIDIDEPEHRISRHIYHAMIMQERNELSDAKEHLMQGLQLAKDFSVREREALVVRQLRDLAHREGDLEAYVRHNASLEAVSDQIRGANIVRTLAAQEADSRIARELQQRDRERAILYSTLPKHIADRVARGEVVNDHFDSAAVIFLDIVGFTAISDQLSSSDVVQLLDTVFSTLDTVCKKHDVVKIKTIGDSYMAVAFEIASSEQRIASSEQRAANAALDMLHAISHILPDLPEGIREDLPEGIEVRIGLHCGAVTAGVIGTERMQYDVWGDTVNVASRMESSSEPGRIHVSEAFADALKGEMAKERNGDDSSPFPVPSSLIHRGALEIKGKGIMQTYWLESTNS